MSTNLWMPRTLVVGPGGMRGIALLGTLEVLQSAGTLSRVDTFCGVSVGAIICLLLCCGYTVAEIIAEGLAFDFLSTQPPMELMTLWTKQGLFTNESIRQRLAALVINKLGSVPTLAQLVSQTNRHLLTVTTNVTTERRVLLSAETNPSLSVIDAVLRSINIPFVFLQLIAEDTIFADGALSSPYPVDYFDNGSTNVLGIYARSKYYNVVHPLPVNIHMNKTIDLLVDSTYYYQQRACSNKCRHICISIPVDGTNSSFNIYQDTTGMLEAGRREARQFLDDNLRWFGESEHYVYPAYRLPLAG